MPTEPPGAAAAPVADLARDARPLRRLGLDLPRHRDRRRVDPAVPDGGAPLRASPAVLLAWSIARDGGSSRAEPARVPRQRHRRRAAARRRDGLGRLGRADRAVGDRRAADRADAALGRDPRLGLPRRAAAAPGVVGIVLGLRRRGDPRRAAALGEPGALDPLGAGGAAPLADRLGPRLALRVASGDAAAAAARRDRAPDARRRRRPRASWRSLGGELGGFDPPPISRIRARARLPRSSAACSRSRPMAGCCGSRRSRWSRRTPTSTRSSPSSWARCPHEPIDAADDRRRRGDPRRRRAHRDRAWPAAGPRRSAAEPPDAGRARPGSAPGSGCARSARGRSKPSAGSGSQRSGRSSR